MYRKNRVNPTLTQEATVTHLFLSGWKGLTEVHRVDDWTKSLSGGKSGGTSDGRRTAYLQELRTIPSSKTTESCPTQPVLSLITLQGFFRWEGRFTRTVECGCLSDQRKRTSSLLLFYLGLPSTTTVLLVVPSAPEGCPGESRSPTPLVTTGVRWLDPGRCLSEEMNDLNVGVR